MRTGSCAVECRCRRMRATKRGRMDLHGQERGHDGHGDEERRAGRRSASGITVREQHGNGHDRAELPDGAHRQHGRPEPAYAARPRRAGSAAACPSAVVVRHSATTTESRTSPVAWSAAPTPSARTTETPHEPAARPRWPWRMVREVELCAGQEHRERSGRNRTGQ